MVSRPKARPNSCSGSVQMRASSSWRYARRTVWASAFLRSGFLCIAVLPLLLLVQGRVRVDGQVQVPVRVLLRDGLGRDQVAAQVDVHRMAGEADLPVGPAGHVREDPGRGVPAQVAVPV